MALRVELPGLYIDNVVADETPDRPVLVNRDPDPDEVQVLGNTTIALEIVDVGPDGIDRDATQVLVNGQPAFIGGGSPELQPGFDGPDASLIQTADTLRVVLHPTTSFVSLQVVGVQVVSRTLGSVLPLNVTYTFQIQDLTPPAIEFALAVDPRTVRVVFNEGVRLAGDGAPGDALNPGSYVFDTASIPAMPLTPVSVKRVSDSAVEVEVDFDMSQGATYQITVTGVADVFGNVIGPPGITATFAGHVPPGRPRDRSFELLRLLPLINREMDETEDLRRFLAVLQDVLEVLLSEIDRFTDILDPDLAPEPFLDLMLEDLGNPFAFDLSALHKRRLVSLLAQIYKQKGTAIGIRNAIRFFLGVNVTAVRAFHNTTLVLGESELGVDWELGPSSQFGLYAFDILVERALADHERKQIRDIVAFMRPGHTHFVSLVEPS